MRLSIVRELVVLLTLALTALGQDWADPNAVVDTPELGRIQGLTWLTYDLEPRPFYVFHSIPYAHPTYGQDRFKPSVLRDGPYAEEGETFNATNPLVVCPQGFFGDAPTMKNASNLSLFNIIRNGQWKWTKDRKDYTPQDIGPEEDEDCLVLNINTPKIPAEGEELKYPVIFFIHGGSSTQVWGAPFMGHKFLRHDVVLVTINYRLGVLGALNLGTDDAPGNAAMYDCITALDWVQKYIHHFGGDPDRVTIYGHSAGSMMVSHLLLSPLAAGKFHGVIGASGSALAPWGTADYDSLPAHLEVAHYAGCFEDWPTGGQPNIPEITTCMQNAHSSVLMSALGQYSDVWQEKGYLGFDAKVPSIQHSPGITIPKFLPKSPQEILANREQNDVPLIMGATRHDGSFAFEDIYKKYLLPDRIDNPDFMKNDLLPQLIKTLKATDKSGAFPHIIAATYFGDGIKNGIYEEMLAGLIDLTSVWGFKAPAWELVEEHAKLNPDSYYYAFDFMGFWSTCDLSGSSPIPCGVPHIDDMSMTFQIFPIINEDYAVSRRMVQYFVNFATYGTPNNPDGSDGLLTWEPYDPITHPYLKIDGEDSVEYECRDSWIGAAEEIIPK